MCKNSWRKLSLNPNPSPPSLSTLSFKQWGWGGSHYWLTLPPNWRHSFVFKVLKDQFAMKMKRQLNSTVPQPRNSLGNQGLVSPLAALPPTWPQVCHDHKQLSQGTMGIIPCPKNAVQLVLLEQITSGISYRCTESSLGQGNKDASFTWAFCED